jgi:hypothetical protein
MAGRLCRLAAWIILVVGVGALGFLALRTLIENNFQFYSYIYQMFAEMLLVFIPFYAFFVSLYSMGSALDYFAIRHTIAEVAPLHPEVMEQQVYVHNTSRNDESKSFGKE